MTRESLFQRGIRRSPPRPEESDLPPGKKPGRKTGRKPETIARDRIAWDLKVGGATYEQIGAHLKISKQSAFTAVKRHIDTIPADSIADIKSTVLGLLDRLERETLRILGRDHVHVGAGGNVAHYAGKPVIDDGPKLQAIRVCLAVIQEKSKILGLNAPVENRIDVITHDAFMDAFAKLEREVAELEASDG